MSKKDGYHHGDLRHALLEAARQTLDETGVAGVSLRAVARRAGVSQTAPYRHFKDKAELLAAVAAMGFLQLREAMSSAMTTADDRDRLNVLGRCYVNFARQNAGMYRLMFGPEIIQIDRDDSYWQASQGTFDFLADVIAADAGRSGPESRAEALAAWSLVHGLSMLVLDGQVALAPGEDVDQLIDQVLSRGRQPT